MININIFNDSKYQRLPRKSLVELTTKTLISEEILIASVNIIYVNEEKILDINKYFLKHNYITDVISFNLEANSELLGEIYICIDTAKRQAEEYKTSLRKEIERLAIHGILHLAGYDDTNEAEKEIMTNLENKYLG